MFIILMEFLAAVCVIYLAVIQLIEVFKSDFINDIENDVELETESPKKLTLDEYIQQLKNDETALDKAPTKTTKRHKEY